jgi:hypothetical protein
MVAGHWAIYLRRYDDLERWSQLIFKHNHHPDKSVVGERLLLDRIIRYDVPQIHKSRNPMGVYLLIMNVGGSVLTKAFLQHFKSHDDIIITMSLFNSGRWLQQTVPLWLFSLKCNTFPEESVLNSIISF